MADRATLALREPDADDDSFRSIDPWEPPPHVDLHRVCHAAFSSPWYFSSDGGGRFDLRSPEGTCYWATSLQGALSEVFGDTFQSPGVFGADWFDKRRKWTASIVDLTIVRCVDMLSPTAARVGVTSELFAHTDPIEGYGLLNRWAARIRSVGWTALRTGLRFFSPLHGHNVAVFGPQGPQPTCEGFAHSGPIAFAVADIDTFASNAGIKIVRSGASSTAFVVLD